MAAGEDTRYSWIAARVCSSLKVRPETFQGFLASENRSAIASFLEDASTQRLFITSDGKDLAATAKLPGGGLKQKTVYFVKTKSKAISNDDIKDLVVFGDFSGSLLEILNAVSRDVMLPLLTSPTTKNQWPDVLSSQVTDSLLKFVANAAVTAAHSRGQTLLPLPHGPGEGAPPLGQRALTPKEQEQLQLLEAAALTWTRQVKQALRTAAFESLNEEADTAGPLEVSDFWVERQANLLNIQAQLDSEAIQSVSAVLEACKSNYFPAFKRLATEVADALGEAKDCMRFLNALRPHILKVTDCSNFAALPEAFGSLMQTMLLVWTHSQHFNSPAKLLALTRRLSNALIAQARAYLPWNELLGMESQEATEKLETVHRVLASFRTSFLESRARSRGIWKIHPNAPFARLTAFSARCREVSEIKLAVLQFGRLERIEIGGTKGKALTAVCRAVHTEFSAAAEKLFAAEYDSLDLSTEADFTRDAAIFKALVRELDKRLAAVILQGCEDCTTVVATFKLLEGFEGVLERPVIASDLHRNHLRLLSAYAADLGEVIALFKAAKSKPPLPVNAAPFSGAIIWADGLLDRVSGPQEKIKTLGPAVANSEEARQAQEMFGTVQAGVEAFKAERWGEWCHLVSQTSEAQLRKPLLQLEEGALGHVYVNFDANLVSMLRETRYFQLIADQLPTGIPDMAIKIAERTEQFRQQIGSLELLATTHNGVLNSLTPLETPLMQPKLAAVVSMIEQDLMVLNWNSYRIEDAVISCLSLARAVAETQATIKGHIARIRAVLASWAANLLVERKPAQVYDFQDLKALFNEGIATAQIGVKVGSAEMLSLLAFSAELLDAAPAAPAWLAYVNHVAGLVVDGVADMLLASLRYLLSQVDGELIAKAEGSPLLKVDLQLVASEACFEPPLSGRAVPSVGAAFDEWIQAFLDTGALVARLDSGSGDYAIELAAKLEVTAACEAVQSALAASEAKAMQFRDLFLRFSHLWTKQPADSLQEFLEQKGSVQNEVRMDPALAEFEAEIAKYRAIQNYILELPGAATIGYLKIDAQPIKQALNTIASKWIYSFTHYIQSKVVSSVEELLRFVAASNAALDKRVGNEQIDKQSTISSLQAAQGGPDSPQAARKALVAISSCIRDVRKRSDATDALFGPLQAMVAMLGKHGLTVSEGMLKQLEDAPLVWKQLKKKMFERREAIAPLQTAEAVEIQKKSDAFAEHAEDFRKFFQSKAPFAVPAPDLRLEHVAQAYKLLEAFTAGEVEGRACVAKQIADGNALRESQELFELPVSEYSQLQRCQEELVHLTALWDMVARIMGQFDEWKQTLWDAIDVDLLVEETKKLHKEVKLLHKAIRNYPVYKMLEGALKAMLTSLQMVAELHHPSMRERHWRQLMKATGKEFLMGTDFKLGDLLALELHLYADACAEIVDRAHKELIIEKQIAKIEATWAMVALTFAPYQDSDAMQLVPDDAVTEALESDNLQLQNMSGSKYVQANPVFLDKVSTWQRKLGTVDLVLGTWSDMQKKWQALVSIFLGSADIRQQLPADSQRFDAVNADFKDLMKAAPEVKLVVDACHLEGRHERLDALLTQLEMCEKALQDYLEMKRIAFPRFYFVAPTDLLDILSKGSDPQLVLRHLSKNFDNVHNLEFTKDESGKPTKNAIGMYSGEGEYVPFAGECLCDGPVEVWLQAVVDSMRAALSAEFKAGVLTYDEKPRGKWLFDNSAQNTIVVSRTFFTADVNAAFDDMEDGNEDALKVELEKQVAQLAELITIINSKLTSNERKKLITLCTIDVHARDVVQRLIDERVDSKAAFQWQSQLRYSQHAKTKECQVNICDAEVMYRYEYIGNCGCLCITPLTDRCYITLTQAQQLVLGGAPAGPAGTGKTETTKDLARALGMQCYVFNCSDQMDYKAMGQIYKGLAQTGAWGCFDEFNRIPVSVLSVCSTQYKTVLDALRARKQRFLFEGNEIALQPSVMAFITMNPGYPGRAELPESLKALFRPVSMCIPDLALICEIMLMAEGFQQSKPLSRKFVILYKLCEDLLSKSQHYDWKLRAIKTTLTVAGGMKRAAPELSEDKVLLRALRDFNLGKLTADDTGIFMGLLNDIFPKTLESVPRAVNRDFESHVREAAKELGYQPDETFCLKISQLREIFEVRWSVFLLGPAGCGKTAIWKTLMRAQQTFGEKTVYKPINPKAVSRNELYGYLHPATREWREGIISVTFRDMANNKTNKHQWIVLDGDIDAEWIESMNTVMDDNRMLTLASNERIPLTPTMRLLLEINHMNHCSPATVSRGGVIYVNATDIGWKPAVDSWIQKVEAPDYRPLLAALFERYVDVTLDYCRRNFKAVVALPAISQVQTACNILEGFLPKDTARGAPPPDKRLLEHYFIFACIWAFGGCMLVDNASDFQTAFSKWWILEWKAVAFPDGGTVFDYCVDEESCSMVHWETRVPAFTYQPENFGSMFVPTVDTMRISFLLELLMARNHFVMLVGNTGTGKTAIMRNMLASMDGEAVCSTTINLNCFSDAPTLQPILEAPLEKKSGVRYGPPGSKQLIYFVDDCNMPFVDKYDTQSAIELMRQSVDYRGWYDKAKVVLKEVTNVQYCACMNPTAGSFSITPRMQRHFATFAVQMPAADVVRNVYSALLEGHLGAGGFDAAVKGLGGRLVDATIELHRNVMQGFLPSAVKFHYQFNLRELSNITQGLCLMTKEFYKEPGQVVRLWVHECERVLADRMVNKADLDKFADMCAKATRKHFADIPQPVIEAQPNLFTPFVNTSAEDTPVYTPAGDEESLRALLTAKMAEHNESNVAMDLVLFQQAVEHICRIARVISLPRGNVMLVGVGGSGKQSLARMASFLCGHEVFQISVSSAYGMAEFKADLLGLYAKAGAKGTPVTFLLTDTHIINERFLVYINDLLSTGYIADLCTQEEKDNFCNAVRAEVKAAGLLDTQSACWAFFVEKVRTNLHLVLCFSPVGEKLRVRARQFPALVNSTVLDWFHPWPAEALVSVASRFLTDIPDVDEVMRTNIAHHMAYAHQSVTDASQRYLEVTRRYNYTTPKSYLELISLFKLLLASKRAQLSANKLRLQNGVEKISHASAQVALLQEDLKAEVLVVEEKKARTFALIESIGQEKAVVDEAVESSRADEEDAAKLQAEVIAFQDECSKDLAAAEPIIREAEAALNSLDKASLGELKSFGSPAADVAAVVSACMVLTAAGGKIPKDVSWAACKKFMGNVDAFLKSLLSFDKDNIPEACVDKVEKDYMKQSYFTPEAIKAKSAAAGGLCAWVVNICKYFRIYQVVAPKRAALAEANARLQGANQKLSAIRAKVAELRAKVADLEDNLMKATLDKNAAVAQAEKTESKAKLATRLISGLGGEFQRWTKNILEFTIAEGNVVGDALLAAAFVSYAAPFMAEFRKDLVASKWIPDLKQRAIPMTPGKLPLELLATDADMAKWRAEGLQSDSLSQENGAIMANASRWSLLIDPQLQGRQWIAAQEAANNLCILQQSQPNYVDKVLQCIQEGRPLLLENLPEDIDAVLDPVIGKQIIRRGKGLFLKVGDAKVEYDPNFRLYLHTKLANPHYRPEIAAQTTLVNFCVTETGLEEQLLAAVVAHERPDLQEQAAALVKQLADFTILLTGLEDNLLKRLASSQGDILEDVELVESLEATKRTATSVTEQVRAANESEARLSAAREVYRPVASRGSLLYFLINALPSLDRVYYFSMANFALILQKGMDQTLVEEKKSGDALESQDQQTEAEAALKQRVAALIDRVTFVVFSYVAQGLFERHKLVVAAQLTMAILKKAGRLALGRFELLMSPPKRVPSQSPMPDWLPDNIWEAANALKDEVDYRLLPDDLIGSAKRWQDWMSLQRPEEEPLPGDWKRMPELDRLVIVRTLRPDRLTAALARFVAGTIGQQYITSQAFSLERSFQDASPGIPMFVFLSPGVDVAAGVEALGRKRGFTADTGRYASVSLGQGQEPIAMRKLEEAHAAGGWVLLQNIHLTMDWTSGPLEKAVDKLAVGAHPDFRLFLSAEAPPALEKGLPISLLQNCIKLTNEPPEGLKANLKRAYGQFNDDILEGCAKQTEFRALVFALAYFHAALLERKKFGVGNLPGATSGIGWNMNYPFNTGDLLCCSQCAANYLDANAKVPWDNLRYIIGEIMYGGHVVEDWDRRLTLAYLQTLFQEGLLEGHQLFPQFDFRAPTSNMNHRQTLEYIDDSLPQESPTAFGMHPNAGIGFRLRETDSFAEQLKRLQPRSAGGGSGTTVEEKAKLMLDDIRERLPEPFDVDDIRSRVAELSPYIMVAIQESERMNALLAEMKRGLQELDLGLKGGLTMTAAMEALMLSLATDLIPLAWKKLAAPSLRGLASWFPNLLAKHAQLAEWTADLAVPKSVWLSGLFNPQSFLTAVMQTTARRNDWPLDKTVLVTEVTKKLPEQLDGPSRDGAFVHGLTLEGARWDEKTGFLDESLPKELLCSMPVLLIRAVPADRAELRDVYQCPVYATEARFRQEIFTAQLKTKQPPNKWTMAGVALFLDVV